MRDLPLIIRENNLKYQVRHSLLHIIFLKKIFFGLLFLGVIGIFLIFSYIGKFCFIASSPLTPTLKRQSKKNPRRISRRYIELVHGPHFLASRWATVMLLTPPPPTKTKKFSSTRDSNMLRCSMWGFNPSLDHLNQDWKKGKEIRLLWRVSNVALTPSSTSLWVKTAIPCVLSLNFENRGE